jgi:hypothetical protein
MKIKKEIINGFIIFIGIAAYFLLMEVLGLSNIFYLRFFNIIFIIYAVNNTLQHRIANGEKNFISNAVSATVTSLVGVTLSILGLLIYSHIRGGEEYINNLSETFLFGGHPSINMYCLTLFFEGVASSVIVTMMFMLFYNDKFVAD